MQSAYNNSSEVELNNSHEGVVSDQITQLGEYTSDTKIAKQFDGVWFEGLIRRYDAEEGLYWVLYSDGDSEDLDEREVQQAIEDYRQHMQPALAVDKVGAADGDEVASDSTNTAVAVVTQTENVGIAAAHSTSTATSYTLPPEMALAMAALTAATEGLTAAAERLIAQSSQSQQQQQQLQQQRMFLQQEQQAHSFNQQQQQRVWLQQQQRMYWQWR